MNYPGWVSSCSSSRMPWTCSLTNWTRLLHLPTTALGLMAVSGSVINRSLLDLFDLHLHLKQGEQLMAGGRFLRLSVTLCRIVRCPDVFTDDVREVAHGFQIGILPQLHTQCFFQ